MSLSAAQLGSLLLALQTESSSGTLRSWEVAFNEIFTTENDKLKACTALCILLMDCVISIRTQVLLSHWLLIRHNQSVLANPFLPFLLDILSQPGYVDRAVLITVMMETEPPKGAHLSDVNAVQKMYELPMQQLLSQLDSSPHSMSSQCEEYMQHLKISCNKYNRSQQSTLGLSAYGIRPVISRPDSDSNANAFSGGLDVDISVASLMEGSGEDGFNTALQPIFHRCEPPLHPPVEMKWISPQDSPSILYDTSLSEDSKTNSDLKDIFSLATTSSISPSQSAAITAGMTNNPGALGALDLSPANLPALVEHNPALASDLLVRFLKQTPPLVGPFDGTGRNGTMQLLDALLTIDMSLHSMEVVNHLSTNCANPGGLPVEFIRTYISNCMNYCDNVKDKYLQNRLVRLLCVFIQSLIRNKVLSSGEPILSQVQTFCVEFSKIREANGLFKLLKSLDMSHASV